MAGESRRDLIYRMSADPAGFKRGMEEAGKSTRGFDRELRKLEQQQARVDAAMTDVGTGLLIAGAAIAAGLAYTAKAAIEWESAWTGVAKVLDGSPEQLAGVEAELRELSKTLPATHAEIASVAEAAGQLGIATEDITEFSQVMLAMGVATTMASDEAAFALARMMNIMQTTPDNVDRLGATIVDLGNNAAATESEIVEMALRIAGAGKTVGMSEADVLGFAAALSSVGVAAEAGGSAISRAFVNIDGFVRGGGEKLELLAQVAGVSADEFKRAFEQDAAGAVAMFVEGLGRMNASGQDVFSTLKDLGMSEIRLRDSLLRLSQAGDLVNQMLGRGNQAWDENTALMEEAERRYGTTEARIQIALNKINDFAISLGEYLLPIIGDFVDMIGNLGAAFGDLPEWVQLAIVVFGVLTAAILLVGGTALITVPKIMALRASLATLAAEGGMVGKAARGMQGLASVITSKVGFAFAGLIAIVGVLVAKNASAKARIDELTATFDEQTGAITDNSRAWVVNELTESNLIYRAQELGISTKLLTDAILGESGALEELNRQLDDTKASVEGYGEEQMGTLSKVDFLRDGIDGLIGDLGSAQRKWELQAEAMGKTGDATTSLTSEQQVLADKLSYTSESAVEAAESLTQIEQSIRDLLDFVFGLVRAEDALAESIEKVIDLVDENGKKWTEQSDAGRQLRREMEAVIGNTAALAAETYKQTGSVDAAIDVIDEMIDELKENAEALFGSTEAAQVYIDALEDMKGEYEVKVTTIYTNKGQFGGRNPQQYFQHGGLVTGGPPGIDTVPAMLTNDEYVINAAATRRHLPLLEAINSGRPVSTGDFSGQGAQLHVQNLEVKSVGVDFRTKQVRDDLAFHLALSGGV